jgi:PAS domain-containing protein
MKYKSRIKGELRHWLVEWGINYDVNGKVTGSIGIHLDITDQKKKEKDSITFLNR